MTTVLITALQTHGQQHKGTDLGGLLQLAALHIQSQGDRPSSWRHENDKSIPRNKIMLKRAT